MNARHVGRPLDIVHLLQNIREFILVRNPMNVRDVGVPLVWVSTLPDIEKVVLVFCLLNDRHAQKPFASEFHWESPCIEIRSNQGDYVALLFPDFLATLFRSRITQ